MIKNPINRDGFRSAGIDTNGLQIRGSNLAEQVYNAVGQLISEIEALKASIASLQAGDYTGTVYAVDEENNTVRIFCQDGKVKTVSRTITT